MAARETSLGVCAAGVLLAWLAAAVPVHEAFSAGAAASERAAAQIAAGEFGPALATARAVVSVAERDALLAQIAGAQAAGGGWNASLETAAGIDDERVRAAALSEAARAPIGSRGGGAMADFDSLIQLITSTIQPESWEDVGGPGSIAPFTTGVYIDPDGTLQLAIQAGGDRLAALRGLEATAGGNFDARRNSTLRKVSLPRLEKQLQLRAAARKGPTEEMEYLAGLRRIQYVFVYPETRDLVIAGPAGGWQVGAEGRIVSVETSEPVVRLEDLVVILRRMMAGDDLRLGCLIVPSQEGLARVKAFAEQSSQQPLKQGERARWLATLREKLGKQNLEVYGIDPGTRIAAVMLEADYRMKLVGMGIEEGVPGVESYLELVRRSGDAPSAMSVLRWWFTLNYDAVLASEDRTAFAFRGPGVKVLSENELLAADGERIHTGKSDDLNRQFAQAFTGKFEQLSEVYPIYAELRNVCDLSIACALVRRESLAERIGWSMAFWGDDARFPVRLGPTPRQVDSVIGYRVLRRGVLVVGVSGGVRVDPERLVSAGSIATETGGDVSGRRAASPPPDRSENVWWWD